MRYRLFGVPADALSMRETVDACMALVDSGKFAQHVVLNAGKVVMMQDDPRLKEAVAGCDLVNADGQSVVWAGRLLGVPFPERVAGIDLMLELLDRAELGGLPVFFLGATQDVLGAFLEEVARRWPGLIIAGSRNGYFDDDDAVADEIAVSGARLLFVGISSPRKELLLAHERMRRTELFAMGVGGSFDVLAGRTKRAPRWMQKNGLEWFFRFVQEPGRMWKRYLVGNARFCAIVLRTLVTGGRATAVESGGVS